MLFEFVMESNLPTEASQVSVIKDAVIEFLNQMQNEKGYFEQIIREKSEEIKSEMTQLGKASYTPSDIDMLTNNYKEFFLKFFKNSIHVRLVTIASHYMRTGIENSIASSGIVQDEVIREFQRLQELQLESSEATLKLKEYEENLLNQTETYSDSQSDNMELQHEIQTLRNKVREKEQENTELQNKLVDMENQVNLIGNTMMKSSTDVEELQEVLANRDVLIQKLRKENSQLLEQLRELDKLKQQIKELTERERELLAKQSTVSNDFIKELQSKYDEAQNELFKLKSDEVNRNEELRKTKLLLEEKSLLHKEYEDKLNQNMEAIESLKSDYEGRLSTLTEKYKSLEQTFLDLQDSANLREEEFNTLDKEFQELKTTLSEKEQALEQYQGMVTMSSDEKTELESRLKLAESRINEDKEVLEYFESLIVYDPKFRILAILDSMDVEIHLPDLSTSLNLPEQLIHRSLVELADFGAVELRRDGNLFFAKSSHKKGSPISLSKLV